MAAARAAAAAVPAVRGKLMATPTTTQVTRLSAEEAGYLTAGPGRAAETVLARLLDVGALRVSRDGYVTAVQNTYQATTSIEARILSYARTPVRFDTMVQSTANSTEMAALHQYLLDRGLVQRPRRRNETWWVYLVIAGFLVLLGFSTPVFLLGVPVAVAIFLWQRGRKAITTAGKEALHQVSATDRVHAVALYGFCGKINGQAVADLFELSQSIVKMLPLKTDRKKRSSSDGGGGCGSSCSSCGSGCGSSSCSSSSSGSSCSSGGSSCGGGGCGGGGGGGD
ncbi:TIGR04222 domain-containing membrane protein [Lentzea sp. NPDC051838]|uniref:TIGR04222 domain-containing membrane protein n=1 Tax=Lentzea sp. NPDC051838 TaxID=3154849 RepID=UPI003449C8F7